MQDIEHTQEPWTMGKPPYHGNEIHGVDRADGSRQLVAQVYGYSREEVVANMRRITVCVNACAGIPTETLEAGEVVPLALVDSIIREVLTNEEKYVPAAMLGNQGLNAYHGIMREIRNALSRLQQNWEQPAETRITATIDVQTYRGYRDRRVIEVEPGIGWADRLGLEVQRVAQEMEEFHLNGPSKQNGGADHD